MSANPSAVILASGGMDSTTLAYWLLARGIRALPVFINYGQHCANTERDTLRQALSAVDFPVIESIDVSEVYKGCGSRLIDEADLWVDEVSYKDMYLPYRSLLLMSVGAAFAQSRGLDAVYAGFINSNHAQEIDCSSAFFDRMADVLVGFGGVQMIMPFRDMTKSQVAAIGVELGVRIGVTYSCQASSVVPCGACPNCVDRLTALASIESK